MSNDMNVENRRWSPVLDPYYAVEADECGMVLATKMDMAGAASYLEHGEPRLDHCVVIAASPELAVEYGLRVMRLRAG